MSVFMSEKSKFILLAVLVFFFLFLPICSEIADSCGKMSSNNVNIIKKNLSGQTITVPLGAIIRIELPFLGSAGYKWHLSNFNPECLELVSEKTEEISEEGLVGAPVLAVWLFEAKKAGETEIKIDQYRPWEGVEKATDHFILGVLIK
ncbi:MAG: protease inhibitor I42 family protein [Syntrophaceae bacterium]|nr:protease inhibitor I42 family protein [Syntrophaceae bacterium]